MRNRVFEPIEVIILLIVIVVVIGVIYNRYNLFERVANINVAEMDRRNLILANKLFYVKNGRFPNDLGELEKSGGLVINSTPIVSKKTFFKNGTIYDPFGNPYQYDSKTGTVYFSKKSMEIITQK